MLKKELASVLCVTSFILVLLGPTIAGNAKADIPTIVPGHTYDFYDATGGEASGHTTFTDGRFDVVNRKAEAYSCTIGTGFGATGWGVVWKTVTCGGGGYYYTTVEGHWWGIWSCAGGADTNIWFYVKIKNLDTGSYVTDFLVQYLGWMVMGAGNSQDYFSCTIVWPANYGYHYGIGVMAKAQTEGVIGSAIADALGDQGIYFTHIKVWSSGGGGCVLGDTNIAMSDGTNKVVEQVRKGDSITGFDLESGSFVSECVVSNARTFVDVVEVINNGALTTTPLDQPVYARNDTFAGWVQNAADLRIGWQLFCPLNQTWVSVTEIRYEVGKFRVWEIGAAMPDNYVANGFLLDKKIQ